MLTYKSGTKESNSPDTELGTAACPFTSPLSGSYINILSPSKNLSLTKHLSFLCSSGHAPLHLQSRSRSPDHFQLQETARGRWAHWRSHLVRVSVIKPCKLSTRPLTGVTSLHNELLSVPTAVTLRAATGSLRKSSRLNFCFLSLCFSALLFQFLSWGTTDAMSRKISFKAPGDIYF